MKCKICNREAKGKYCEIHERAYRNIVNKYDFWISALNISWEDYIKEVAKNSYTGSWAKEVAEHLMESWVGRT